MTSTSTSSDKTAPHKTPSESDDHPEIILTPDYTPSETPPPTGTPRNPSQLNFTELPGKAKMDAKEAGTVADEVNIASNTEKSDKPEVKQAKPERQRTDKTCKKHTPAKKAKAVRRKKRHDNSSEEESSSSEDTSDSDTDDSDSDLSESESDDTSAGGHGRKQRSRRSNKKKAGTKSRRSRHARRLRSPNEDTESDSPSDDATSNSSTSEKEPSRRSKKSASKRARNRKHRNASDEPMTEDSDTDNASDIRARMDTINELLASATRTSARTSRGSRLGRGGRTTNRRSYIDRYDEDEPHSTDILDLQEQMDALNELLEDGTNQSKTGKRGEKNGRKRRRRGRRSRRSKAEDADTKHRKRGSKLEFKRVDQLWDRSIHNFKLTETAEDKDAVGYDQYIFTVRRNFDWENKYTDTVVDIKSKTLKEALNEVMDGIKGISLVEETPSMDPNMLFLYLEEMRTLMKGLKAKNKTERKKKIVKANARKISHIKVLLKYLDEDYADTKKTLYPLLKSNLITFDLLWALFKPNTIAYTTTYGNADEPRAFKVEYATKESSFMKGTWYCVEGRYLEYDGKTFGMGTMAVDIPSFKGARKISNLATFPLSFHRDQETLRQTLIERGRKFVALKGMNYRFHQGMAFYKKKRSVIKVNINGRIMVDPAIHRRINPNYAISTVKPKELEDEDDEDYSDEDSCCCCGQSDDDEDDNDKGIGGLGDEDEPERTRLRLVLDDPKKRRLVRVKVDENGDEVVEEKLDRLDKEGKKQEDQQQDEDEKEERQFTEEELIVASPVVLGFAFSEKLWLEFSVSGVQDIEWNEGAFASLVLPENQKTIVKALVESHKFHAAQNIDDVIQGKGKGLVAVLHGPPGTGKTLTAEGVAELLKCPLYMVSVGELGTDSRTLEAELNKILDIAHSWGALLLLDEADVFLEKRTIQDIHRNALVSIFLRLLEYFQGILFLTTNRVETFDDAFQSRIHVALRYGELNTKAKISVWKMFLGRVKDKEGVKTATFKDNDLEILARNNLNGRQIKNAVRTAVALAVNEDKTLSMEHIKRVLQVAESFDHDLKGGTGYMDAMRSYT
ncbi:MAG: hypothetical protein M1833_000180 [Piccolia ochrophora]|nr:MAG: hypothetical protein M1833_000180 [Piccolia ochrophora]